MDYAESFYKNIIFWSISPQGIFQIEVFVLSGDRGWLG